jgi:hypothetical protein
MGMGGKNMSAKARPNRDRPANDDPGLQRPEDLEFLAALERAIEATIRLQHAPDLAPSQREPEPEPSIEPEPFTEPEPFAETEPLAEEEPEESPELTPLSTTPAPIRRWMSEREPDPNQMLRAHARMEPALDEQSRREAAIEMLRQRRRPEPDDFQEPPRDRRRWNGVAFISRLMLAAGVAVSAGFVIYHFTSLVPRPTEQAAVAPVRAGAVGRAPADHQPVAKPAGRLVLTELSGAANRPVALGVTVDGPPPGAIIMVRGLPANSRITAGVSAGEGAWRIPAPDLVRAAVVPPADFVGVMNLSIDLTLPDGTISDSDVLQLRWTPTLPDAITPRPVRTTTIAPEAGIYAAVAPPVAAVPPTPSPPPAPAPKPETSEPKQSETPTGVVRHLDRDELDKLLKRGEKFLENGDISAARLLLRRAAEAGDARAALALATTYDPLVLKQIGALGAKADVAQAQTWYQKASELGSAEAVVRLQRLAQEAR